METKKEIRKRILTIRDEIPAEDRKIRGRKIKEQMLQSACYRRAEVILAYVSYRSEVDTIGLIGQALSDGKRVFAPKVSGDEMEFWQIGGMEDLQSGYQGIMEPAETVSFPVYRHPHQDGNVLMWMPGAVFDESCHRIGYGKGFYDRYLERIGKNMGNSSGLTTVALAYRCQVLKQIPFEPHDYRPDYLLTECGLICR